MRQEAMRHPESVPNGTSNGTWFGVSNNRRGNPQLALLSEKLLDDLHRAEAEAVYVRSLVAAGWCFHYLIACACMCLEPTVSNFVDKDRHPLGGSATGR